MRKNEFLFKQPPFAPVLGAICSKMQCVLPLNAVQYAAKCNAFWCKTRGKMPLNAVQNAAKC